MLNPRLRAFAESLLPGVVVRALDPFEARVGQAVEEFSQSLPNGSRVLGIGLAGADAGDSLAYSRGCCSIR